MNYLFKDLFLRLWQFLSTLRLRIVNLIISVIIDSNFGYIVYIRPNDRFYLLHRWNFRWRLKVYFLVASLELRAKGNIRSWNHFGRRVDKSNLASIISYAHIRNCILLNQGSWGSSSKRKGTIIRVWLHCRVEALTGNWMEYCFVILNKTILIRYISITMGRVKSWITYEVGHSCNLLNWRRIDNRRLKCGVENRFDWPILNSRLISRYLICPRTR